ncbi:DNA translocase FtsK [Candidatus Venteria ishoeyi]|uniref:DNA translocase FtsK n=1 Tax=Candidatus Venteria ishoeyi TaxID=1899563 RepID=A0A1H6FCZ6_9GAMM|nr:DNA translocase FtsK [Candidatus Venteria ishoeyi]SEH07261.1 DNA translocase FtsK [Candidatus Venteria ishoeyi]
MSQARRNKKLASNSKLIGTGLREIVFIFFCFAALYLFVSLATYYPLDPGFSHNSEAAVEIHNKGGLAGALFADLFFNWFGYFAYLFAFMVGYLGWLIYKGRHHDLLAEPKHLIVPGFGFLLTLTAGCGLAIVHFAAESALLPSHAGGVLGGWIGNGLKDMISSLGATLLLLVLFFTGITLLTGMSWVRLMDKLGAYTLHYLPIMRQYLAEVVLPLISNYLSQLFHWLWFWSEKGLVQAQQQWQKVQERHQAFEQDEPLDESEQDETATVQKKTATKTPVKPAANQQQRTTSAEKPEASAVSKSDSLTPKSAKASNKQSSKAETLSEKNQAPALPALNNLLLPGDPAIDEAPATSDEQVYIDPAILKAKIESILKKLRSVAVLKGIYPGPVVSRVEIQPSPKLSQLDPLIQRLTKELNLSHLRMVEATPELIIFEVPKTNPEQIPLSSLLLMKAYQDSRSPLTLALGKETSGNAVIVDLARMPHLLMAGQNGDDIDTAIHSAVLSLLYKATSDEVRLLMLDSKHQALSRYKDLLHLFTPIIHSPEKVQQAFRWTVAEMERRYRLMADLGVRNIDGYNRKVKASEVQETQGGIPISLSPIPYIVMIVHEIAEITAGEDGREIEELITRLAQKARASGIHLILATREPGVNVVTGLMKTNFPTRICFQVDNANLSRNMLGKTGAENLLGNGDMFYMTPGTGVPVRLHGTHVTIQEVRNVLADLKKRGKPAYEKLEIPENSSFRHK